MADRDILRQLAQLTKEQLGTVRSFLFQAPRNTKKLMKPKDQATFRKNTKGEDDSPRDK